MAAPTPVRLLDWQSLLQRLQSAFGVAIPEAYRSGEIDLDQLLLQLQALQPDLGKPAQFAITYELRQALATCAGVEPHEILDTTAMASLLPGRLQRRQAMQTLQAEVDWRLPRIGLPIWAQYLWGAALLVGFVLQFIYPLTGILIFWVGMLASFQVEKVAWAFQYPTFGKWIERVVQLNWPSIALGALDDAQLRVAYADLIEAELGLVVDPRAPLGAVLVRDAWQGWPAQAHLLNGDALRLTLEELEIPGERKVMRECMCVGPVAASADFFQQRATFIHHSYDAAPDKYQQWVMAELNRLDALPAATELNLWFEEDLFCQANLWFTMDRLAERGRRAKTYLVLPKLDGPRLPDGFGNLSAEALAEALRQRILLTDSDFSLAQALWQAYQIGDLARLQAYAQQPASHWRCLPEIVQALADRQPDVNGWGLPHRILQQIVAEGHTEFEAIFAAFKERASIYGYGDLQVKSLLREIDFRQNPD